MADQPPIRDVVLRCRTCGNTSPLSEESQQCQKQQCHLIRLRDEQYRWSGWEIAHITRAEAA